MHLHPCPETNRIDEVLNELEESSFDPTDADIALARKGARIRHEASARFNDYLVSNRGSLISHSMGVLSEMMVARYLGIDYRFHVNSFRLADVAGDIEVRSTEYVNGHLKIRPDDNDKYRAVLAIVTPDLRSVRLAGWIKVIDGKQFPMKDPKMKNMPFHFVPQSALKPMFELAQARERQRS